MVGWIVWGSIIPPNKLDMGMGGEKMWGGKWGNNCIVDIQTREDKILDKDHDLKNHYFGLGTTDLKVFWRLFKLNGQKGLEMDNFEAEEWINV